MSIHTNAAFKVAQAKGALAGTNHNQWNVLIALSKRELIEIDIGFRFGVGRLAVLGRIDVCPARKDDAVEPLEQCCKGIRRHGRDEHWQPAGALDRVRVGCAQLQVGRPGLVGCHGDAN